MTAFGKIRKVESEAYNVSLEKKNWKAIWFQYEKKMKWLALSDGNGEGENGKGEAKEWKQHICQGN